MKSENLRKIFVAALLLAVAFAALPGTSLAGWGWGHHDQTAMTEEERQELQALEEKYAPQLKALEERLDAKADEVARARSKGSTTLAEMDALRDEMHRLKEEYLALSEKAGAAGAGHHSSSGHGGYGHRHQSPGYGCGCGCNGPGNHHGPAAGRRGWGCRW